MKTEDYNYDLQNHLIAQSPLEKRSESKLLVLDKETGEITHHKFSEIINYLNKGDALVINNTKVLPARLIGEKEETHAVIEMLLLKEIKNNTWETLIKPQKRIKKGTKIKFTNKLLAEVVEIKTEGLTIVKLIFNGVLLEILEQLGEMPLPPYIHKKLKDKNRYQTVYAEKEGSAAAPTAGLHFTNELFQKIEEKGIKIIKITLHVGLGTFRPVNVQDLKKHTMHTEYYEISKEAANQINKIKDSGGKIIAVGTTTVRALESSTINNKVNEIKGETNIFIYPGYKFKITDSLITNFHLPKSTLLMLVSALSRKEYILHSYNEAIKKEYRFFSFGDSMIIK
ncbi:MAG: tRNA preQ1(34) S-adenosylmethionine ribosyltransferase-isomerase QueA [Bacilli bacterium]|nr:tRNA preQ1(34) S-adenosylmethionine ribosyltransferase-isomerase QueA [Bacilli bacterium]